jgi:catechol 2,3-dioxygenase-like lactoylglutathione lyase family enzyme
MGTPEWQFTHVHVYASEPEVTVAWLTDGLGGEVVSETQHAGYPKAWIVELGGQLVQVRGRRDAETFASAGPRSFGIDHIGLAVADLEAALAQLQARGVEPVTEFEGGFSIPAGIAFLRGPDELWVEITPTAWAPGADRSRSVA